MKLNPLVVVMLLVGIAAAKFHQEFWTVPELREECAQEVDRTEKVCEDEKAHMEVRHQSEIDAEGVKYAGLKERYENLERNKYLEKKRFQREISSLNRTIGRLERELESQSKYYASGEEGRLEMARKAEAYDSLRSEIDALIAERNEKIMLLQAMEEENSRKIANYQARLEGAMEQNRALQDSVKFLQDAESRFQRGVNAFARGGRAEREAMELKKRFFTNQKALDKALSDALTWYRQSESLGINAKPDIARIEAQL